MNTFLMFYTEDESGYGTDEDLSDMKSSSNEDDDKSLASTVCTSTTVNFEESSVSLSHSSSSTLSCGRQGVCFDDDANILIENPHVFHEEDVETLWYNASDYQNFKAAASATAQLIRKRSPMAICSLLDQSYQDCCWRRPNEDVGNGDDNGRLRVVHHQWTMCRLRQLYGEHSSSSDYCIGLETRLSRSIPKDRAMCRRELARIMYTQHIPMFLSSNCAHTDAKSEALRLHCEKFTYRSCLFARLTAQALAEIDPF